jgi:hypothetical protein
VPLNYPLMDCDAQACCQSALKEMDNDPSDEQAHVDESRRTLALAMGCSLVWFAILVVVAHAWASKPLSASEPDGGRNSLDITLLSSLGTFGWLMVCAPVVFSCCPCTYTGRCGGRFCGLGLCFMVLTIGCFTPLSIGLQLAFYHERAPVSAVRVTDIPFLPRDAAHERYAVEGVAVWPAYFITYTHSTGRNSYTINQLMPLLSVEWARNASAIELAARGQDGVSGPWTASDWGAGCLVWINNYDLLDGWSDAMLNMTGPIVLPAPQRLQRIGEGSTSHGMCCSRFLPRQSARFCMMCAVLL